MQPEQAAGGAGQAGVAGTFRQAGGDFLALCGAALEHEAERWRGGGGEAGVREDQGRTFFFAKKKQKTFICLVRDSTDKSFLVLFFKEELLRA
jgi:hypothetical protein